MRRPVTSPIILNPEEGRQLMCAAKRNKEGFSLLFSV
jgi:hypothetical protein